MRMQAGNWRRLLSLVVVSCLILDYIYTVGWFASHISWLFFSMYNLYATEYHAGHLITFFCVTFDFCASRIFVCGTNLIPMETLDGLFLTYHATPFDWLILFCLVIFACTWVLFRFFLNISFWVERFKFFLIMFRVATIVMPYWFWNQAGVSANLVFVFFLCRNFRSNNNAEADCEGGCP